MGVDTATDGILPADLAACYYILQGGTTVISVVATEQRSMGDSLFGGGQGPQRGQQFPTATFCGMFYGMAKRTSIFIAAAGQLFLFNYIL